MTPPDDAAIEGIVARQQSQMAATDLPQIETDWLFVERKKRNVGWKVVHSVALLFESSTREVQ